jgi:isocitrate dehydrogenase
MTFGNLEQSGRSNRQRVSNDFARLMEDATEIECSQFGDKVILEM